jgi:hypothetical protein
LGKYETYSTASTAATDDILLGVAVHDTTMSALGTTKKYPVATLLAVAANASGPAAKITSYTLTLTDVAPGTNQVDYSSASAGTYTIPAHATVAFPPGACFAVRQIGAGACTIAGAGGVTVSAGNAGAVVTGGQGKLVTVTQDPNTTDTWWVD